MKEWQKARIRRALQIYRTFGLDNDGKDLSWSSLKDYINDFSNVEIKGDRLRQFAMGDTEGFFDPTHMQAVINFLSDPDDPNSPLELKALEVKDINLLIPNLFTEYLEYNAIDEKIVTTPNLYGSFRAICENGNTLSELVLILEKLSEQHIVHVTLLESEYNKEDINVDGFNESFNKTTPLTIDKSSGWCTISPEDNLIFFLKNDRTGRNRHLITVGIDTNLLNLKPAQLLSVIDQDFPLEYEENDISIDKQELAKKTLHDIQSMLLIFQRILS